jgi:hypothetical protein
MTHGVVPWRMRRHGEAGRSIRPARSSTRTPPSLNALLGMPLAIQRAREEAAASAQHALRLSPSDPLVRVCALYAMVGAHFAAGHYADCAARAQDTRDIPRGHGHSLLSHRGGGDAGVRAAAGGGADQPAAPGAGFLAEVVEREHGVSRRGGRAPPRGSPQGGTAPRGTPKIRRLAAILVADVACYSRLIETQSEDYISAAAAMTSLSALPFPWCFSVTPIYLPVRPI